MANELAEGSWRRLSPRSAAALFEESLDGVLLSAPDGQILDANTAAQKLLGLTIDELRAVGRQGVTDVTDARWLEALEERARTGRVLARVRMRRGDGTVFEAEVSSAIFANEDGEARSCVIFRDVTEQAGLEGALRDAESRFRTAFEHAPIGMAIVGLDGRFDQVNRRLCDITGYSQWQLREMTFQDITHPDDLSEDLQQAEALIAGEIAAYQMEKRYLRADGSAVWVMLSGSLVRDADGAPLHFIAQVEDIDARKRAEQRLEYEARHDPLTGLLNRRPFDDAMAACRSTGEGCLLLVDVDGMKEINDSLGHEAGDAVLRAVGRALTRVVRHRDVAARIGGDEFGLVLPGSDAEEARRVADRVRAEVHAADLPLPISVSVGVAACDEREPFEAADQRMYADKRRARREAAPAPPRRGPSPPPPPS